MPSWKFEILLLKILDNLMLSVIILQLPIKKVLLFCTLLKGPALSTSFTAFFSLYLAHVVYNCTEDIVFVYSVFVPLTDYTYDWLQVESYLRIMGEPKLPSAFLQVFKPVPHLFTVIKCCHAQMSHIHVMFSVHLFWCLTHNLVSYRLFAGSWGSMELLMGSILPPISQGKYVILLRLIQLMTWSRYARSNCCSLSAAIF